MGYTTDKSWDVMSIGTRHSVSVYPAYFNPKIAVLRPYFNPL